MERISDNFNDFEKKFIEHYGWDNPVVRGFRDKYVAEKREREIMKSIEETLSRLDCKDIRL